MSYDDLDRSPRELTTLSDGNIRYYEYENDKFEYLSQHSAADPQRGIAFVPKRGVNTHQNEITRVYRTVNDTMVEPVSFVVPRRAEVFQNDIYPPTVGSKPAMSSSEWFGGKDGLPPKINLEDIFDGQEPQEIASEYSAPAPMSKPTPAPTPAPAPTKKEPEPEPKPAPVSSRGPPPSLKDNQSMSSLADKFADKSEDQQDDDDDDFGDVPAQSMRANAMSGISTPVTMKSPEPVRESALPSFMSQKSEPVPAAEPTGTSAPVETATTSTSTSLPEPSAPASTSTAASSSGAGASAAQGLGKHLQDIKAMLEMQQKTMAEQSEKIDALTKEVAALRGSS